MNPDQFIAKFEELSASLKAFVFRLTASEEDAEDILQDTFIKATQALDSLQNEQSLKSWTHQRLWSNIIFAQAEPNGLLFSMDALTEQKRVYA